MEAYRNIIVRMPNWLGDAVMATPVLADLRHHFPDAAITAMCKKNVGLLLKEDPHIDEIFSFERPSGWIHRRKHLEIIQPLRQGEFDLGILLTNSWSSALWFYRGNVKELVGYADNFRSPLLTKAVRYSKKKERQHLVTTYKELLQPLGIPLSTTSPQLYLQSDELAWAKNFLKRMGIETDKHKIIGINPGAAYGSAKCWLPERFVQVSKKLLEDPQVRIVYFGDAAGAPLVDSICSKLPKEVINLAGKTSIRELMALLKCCAVLLTNDSGPMHIAAALATPLLALFGSTNEVKTGPNPQGEVIHKHVECSPCYKRTCPIDFRCMTRIESDEVVETLRKIVEENE